MKIAFERRSFVQLSERDSGRLIEKMQFTRCYFESCFTIARSPETRTTFRDVVLRDCEVRGCTVYSAVLDSVIVDGLKTNGLLQTWATVFRHVVLRGKLGRFMFSSILAPGVDGFAPADQQRAFDGANEQFYRSADWALDLTEAEFEECDAGGVPARLVRRDPVTQVIVTRAGALNGRWRNVDLSGTYWTIALEFFLESQAPDIVLVAPKRARKFKKLLEGLQRLRDCGVAEAG